MDFSHITQEQRELLYNEVWAEPVTTVAKKYNLSDNGLRKHCRRLWIPLPPVGYWAKVNSGQKVFKPELPKVGGELKRYVSNYVIKYRKDLDQLTDDELTNDKELNLLSEETKSLIREICSRLQVKTQLRNPHSLIIEHKEEAAYRRKRDKDLMHASVNSDYLRMIKSKYRDNKAMLPINVSEVIINRTYRIVDTLISTIEDMEGYIRVNIESGKDIAYFVIMQAPVYFEVKEENKNNPSVNKEVAPRLVLSMSVRSWFNDGMKYKLEYKDNDKEPLESQIGMIIYDMFIAANKITVKEKLNERKLHREIEEYERQKKLEQMRKGELEEVKLLEQVVSDWDKAQKIRTFSDSLEKALGEVTDAIKAEKITRWLVWARNKADWLDPLVAKEDELMSKNKHIFDRIIEEIQ